MEQSEAFKNVEAIIKDLEKKLAVCGNINKVCETSANEVVKEIEEHFAKCINALAARKAVLLGEVTQKLQNQRKKVEDIRGKIETSLAACNKTREAAVLLYSLNSATAEIVCKEIKNLPMPNVSETRIAVELPISVFDAIQVHGKVNISSRFASPESVSTFAGSIPGLANANGTKACFKNPWGMCFNPHDNCLYVCDSANNLIRKITPQGDVSTFVTGNSENGIKFPSSIVMHHADQMFYVANHGSHCISKITSAGIASIFAGSGQSGHLDGVGKNATFSYLKGLAIDQQFRDMYVCGGYLVRKVTSQGEVSTLAGGLQSGDKDGNRGEAAFNNLHGICFDRNNQSLLVCDCSNNKLRRVHLDGNVSTLCSVPSPASVSITSEGTILVASFYEHKIFRVLQSGQQYEARAIDGSGKKNRIDGGPIDCAVKNPVGILVHEPSHSCYVSEYNSHSIKKITFANDI